MKTYKFDFEYIKEHLQPNYKLYHVKLGFFVVKQIEQNDNDVIVDAIEITDTKKIRHFSLRTLFTNQLIEDDDLFLLIESHSIETESLKDDFDVFPTFDKTNYFVQKKTVDNRKKIHYSDLFRMMENADKTHFKFSKWFWHYTHIDNLIEIVKDGRFQSRFNIENKIPFDIKKHSEVSKEVQDTNFSRRLQRHVRFYLRPLNASYFRAKHSFDDENNNVWVSITKDALFRSNTSTFLYPKNAHSATDDVFDKENQLNCHFGEPFYLYNFESFNFSETYSIYDKNQSDERKNYQQAEFLVRKDLPISFIYLIYFKNVNSKEKFLESIRYLPCYNDLKDKCVVNSDLFYASGYR